MDADLDPKARTGKTDVSLAWNAGERDTSPASLDASKHETASKSVAQHVAGAQASAHMHGGESVQKG